MTAQPVALSAVGRYGVRLGLWMLERTCSPLSAMRTFVSPVLPSEPGAPFGQRRISLGNSAAGIVVDRKSEVRMAHAMTGRDALRRPRSAQRSDPTWRCQQE